MNIQIQSVDKDKTHNPDKRYKLYNVYVELNKEPPREWKEIFEILWKQVFYSMKRDAWTDGKYIVIYCALDEWKKYHNSRLIETVKKANEEYDKWISAKTKEEEREKNEKELEQKEKDKYLDEDF